MTNSVGKSIKTRKISTRLIRKGALIEETYNAMQRWDMNASIKENLNRIRSANLIGAKNESWLKEIIITLSSRFTSNREVLPLVIMAQAQVDLEKWKPCLLWHIGNTDELYFRFATQWLFEKYKQDIHRMRTPDVIPFVKQITDGKIARKGRLTENSVIAAARDLLKMAADFDLIKGKRSPIKEFSPYHLPQESFLYLVHALAENEHNANNIIHSPYWRLFLMYPDDVERELFTLHQFQKLEYHVAGTLAQLTLPFNSARDCAKEIAS